MAFAAAGFRCSDSGHSGSSTFVYTSNDLATAIDDADYFLDVYDQLTVGDVIDCRTDLDGTPLHMLLLVTAATSVTVTTDAYPIV